MTNLYFNDQKDPRKIPGDQKIFLAETPNGVYDDPGLQSQVQEWIAAHKNDAELSYGKYLFWEALLEPAGALPWRPAGPGEPAQRDQLARAFEPIVERNLRLFLARTMIEGIDDPTRNRKNFEQYVNSMADDLLALKETEDFVITYEDQDFIKNALKLATAAEPEPLSRLKDSEPYERFYQAHVSGDPASIINRSKELIAVFESSAVFAKITSRFEELRDCRDNEDYIALQPGVPRGSDPFCAAPQHKKLLPAAPKIVQATLASKKIFTLSVQASDHPINWEWVDKNFDVVKIIDTDGSAGYVAKNRNCLRALDRSRD